MPGQSVDSKLDPGQTRQMIRFAVRKPADNANSIVYEGLSIVGLSDTNALLNKFGVSVNPNLITVPGRVLDEPKVLYKAKKFAQVRFGGWNMVDVKFNTAGTLNVWSYFMISLPTHRNALDQASLAAAVKQFADLLIKRGIPVAAPLQGQRVELNSPEDARLEQRLEKKGLPRLTVVIVGKRHHTRFYASREGDADRSSNPKPGTVVDQGITEARNWDFFPAVSRRHSGHGAAGALLCPFGRNLPRAR
ncbi:hypothetical protein RB597_007010 [Gaeumannomyces tritici]